MVSSDDAMRTIIVYSSISGFTERYAGWIADALDADLRRLKEIGPRDIRDYDCIVYGGSLHAVGVYGLRKMKRLIERAGLARGAPRLLVYGVGASPPKPETIAQVRDANFTPAEQEGIPFFYFRGGFDFSRLDWFHRIIMTLFRWKIARKSTKTPEELGMLKAYESPADFTDPATIAGLVDTVRSWSAREPATGDSTADK